MIQLPNRYPATRQVTAWSLVAGQLILLAGILWLPGAQTWTLPTWPVVTAWVVVTVAALVALAGLAGLGRGLTASPLPSPAAQLRTTGVYACGRHPVYSALLLGGAAFVVLGGRLSRVWVWIALLAWLLIKTGVEEAALATRFTGNRAYAEATPRLVPHPRHCLASWRRPHRGPLHLEVEAWTAAAGTNAYGDDVGLGWRAEPVRRRGVQGL